MFGLVAFSSSRAHGPSDSRAGRLTRGRGYPRPCACRTTRRMAGARTLDVYVESWLASRLVKGRPLTELAAARMPTERRRIRQTIKRSRRNPFKATSLPDRAQPDDPSHSTVMEG